MPAAAVSYTHTNGLCGSCMVAAACVQSITHLYHVRTAHPADLLQWLRRGTELVAPQQRQQQGPLRKTAAPCVPGAGMEADRVCTCGFS
jgi:hypothetical protein